MKLFLLIYESLQVVVVSAQSKEHAIQLASAVMSDHEEITELCPTNDPGVLFSYTLGE